MIFNAKEFDDNLDEDLTRRNILICQGGRKYLQIGLMETCPELIAFQSFETNTYSPFRIAVKAFPLKRIQRKLQFEFENSIEFLVDGSSTCRSISIYARLNDVSNTCSNMLIDGKM